MAGQNETIDLCDTDEEQPSGSNSDSVIFSDIETITLDDDNCSIISDQAGRLSISGESPRRVLPKTPKKTPPRKSKKMNFKPGELNEENEDDEIEVIAVQLKKPKENSFFRINSPKSRATTPGRSPGKKKLGDLSPSTMFRGISSNSRLSKKAKSKKKKRMGQMLETVPIFSNTSPKKLKKKNNQKAEQARQILQSQQNNNTKIRRNRFGSPSRQFGPPRKVMKRNRTGVKFENGKPKFRFEPIYPLVDTSKVSGPAVAGISQVGSSQTLIPSGRVSPFEFEIAGNNQIPSNATTAGISQIPCSTSTAGPSHIRSATSTAGPSSFSSTTSANVLAPISNVTPSIGPSNVEDATARSPSPVDQLLKEATLLMTGLEEVAPESKRSKEENRSARRVVTAEGDDCENITITCSTLGDAVNMGGASKEAAPVSLEPVNNAGTSNLSVYGPNYYKPGYVENRSKGSLRPIVIDGSNVAFGHGNGKKYSSKGIKLCSDYFLKRGHTVVAFVPRFRLQHSHCHDPGILEELNKAGIVKFTPSREVEGVRITSYDDRYIVQYAADTGGIIVSNDNFKDLYIEQPLWREAIRDRVLQYTWVNENYIMFPTDPLGCDGPPLVQFLRF